MLNKIIERKKREWMQSPGCPVRQLVDYMTAKGKLRDTQIEAIETYLYLKIEGQNKPLWQLFSEGMFLEGNLEIPHLMSYHPDLYECIYKQPAAKALYDFVSGKEDSKPRLPGLKRLIVEKDKSLDYQQIIKNIFYNVSYADYLMSLPMGAGKTYLMAAFIYLDLYFAYNEPENKNFAHNFLVLIPSGLKSSIVPSLRTIENFDPTWVLPDPAAGELKRLLKFEILDEQKSAKKSNKARNPNAQKVNQCLPDPFGQVFVVNAEKVILNRLGVSSQLEIIEKNEDEKDKRENELRNLIGKIPNLSILIDEVHHAATNDIKLRQVVNKWHKTGNITTVLGFSGTPYLSKADKIHADENTSFKFSQISNTVYYYPLVTAVKSFLKTPSIRIGQNIDRFQIIRNGIEDFREEYGETVYGNGSIAKIAIYCPKIGVLEEEVYPFLTGELGIDAREILRFHKGNKKHPQPPGSELEFRSLDLPSSQKRYILLVQVGKEGWDCPSLTGVILSQKGDSPKNMVLQTACRCLRQVDKGKDESALIWLNDYNAQTLNAQLKKEQHTSIQEINRLKKGEAVAPVPRTARSEFLELPPVDFYQLQVKYQALHTAESPHTAAKLDNLLQDIDAFKTAALIKTAEIGNIDEAAVAVMKKTGYETAVFHRWLYGIAKASYGNVKRNELQQFSAPLRKIFDRITYRENETRFWNDLYDRRAVESRIRLAFNIERSLTTSSEIIPQSAQLLLAEKLQPVADNDKLYPAAADVEKILRLDVSGESVNVDMEQVRAEYDKAKKVLADAGMGHMFPPFADYSKKYEHSLAVRSKDRTFHYLPYNFVQSKFEKNIFEEVLKLNTFTDKKLEIYYNGERGLTEFVIQCYARNGKFRKNIGRYTTDFLIIQRNEKSEIHKVLMVETKGEGYGNDPAFLAKKKFVETDFLEQNNEKFGYRRFDFLYLGDSDKKADNTAKINARLEAFFTD